MNAITSFSDVKTVFESIRSLILESQAHYRQRTVDLEAIRKLESLSTQLMHAKTFVSERYQEYDAICKQDTFANCVPVLKTCEELLSKNEFEIFIRELKTYLEIIEHKQLQTPEDAETVFRALFEHTVLFERKFIALANWSMSIGRAAA